MTERLDFLFSLPSIIIFLETLFRNGTLRRHDGLSKAKSSLLIQIRTGAISLRDFLFTRGVPEVLTPACECGEGRETAEHLVVFGPTVDSKMGENWNSDTTGLLLCSTRHQSHDCTAREESSRLADGLGEAADVQLSQEARAGSGGLKRPRPEAGGLLSLYTQTHQNASFLDCWYGFFTRPGEARFSCILNSRGFGTP